MKTLPKTGTNEQTTTTAICIWASNIINPWNLAQIGVKLGQKRLRTKSLHILWKNDIYVKRLERVILSTQMCILQTRMKRNGGNPHGTEFWSSWNKEVKYTNR